MGFFYSLVRSLAKHLVYLFELFYCPFFSTFLKRMPINYKRLSYKPAIETSTLKTF